MFSETNDTESCDRGINQMLMLEIARAKTIQLRFSQTFSSLNEQFHIFNSEFEVRLNMPPLKIWLIKADFVQMR